MKINDNICAIIEVRETLQPKVDLLLKNMNKLPVGKYYLVPLKKEDKHG